MPYSLPTVRSLKSVAESVSNINDAVNDAALVIVSAIFFADNEVVDAIFVPIHHLGAAVFPPGSNINAVKQGFLRRGPCNRATSGTLGELESAILLPAMKSLTPSLFQSATSGCCTSSKLQRSYRERGFVHA